MVWEQNSEGKNHKETGDTNKSNNHGDDDSVTF